ncbi:S41 family peptidase [Ekhidna sp.]|uniref:S41 family peptidase n=1 Tax=Ekhidna sp. TaxID=2608089 RepID=UPI003B5140C9
MRSFILFLITICLLFSCTFVNGNTFKKEGNLPEIERLYLTCKIWGFLKYYHPLVGKGSFNWDDKLQSVLKVTNDITTYEEFSDYMYKWIYYMGELKECKSCSKANKNDLFLENFDLSWTQSQYFSDELQKILKYVENNRFQGNHHYIGRGDLEQFEAKNENQDYGLSWENKNVRLLPLFRYWNYIEYFFPYKYKTDQPWNEVLKEMIPKFLEAKTQLDFQLAMLELVVKVDDSHGAFLPPLVDQLPYFNFPSVKFEMVEDQIMVTEIIDEEKAQKDDLQVGDVLLSINNQSAKQIHESQKKYIWASNEAAKNAGIRYALFMGIKGTAQITIQRNGATKTGSITLYRSTDLKLKEVSKPKWKSINDPIGYVDLKNLTIKEVNEMMEELINKSVLIFDIRNYPRGTYRAIAKYLHPSETTFAIFTRPDYTYPGKFIWSGASSCGNKNEDYYKGKVILLVNEKTQSHAEFTCMCLQTAPNVVIVGSQTAGADGSVTKLPVFKRYYSSLSGVGVYYPDKGETQRIGIVPDIKVKPTAAGVRAGRDEILEAAIEVAKEEIARLIAEAARLEAARLDSILQDSIRMQMLLMDSLQIDSIQMDTLQMDTLQIKDGKQ